GLMKFRGIILLLGSMLFGAILLAQSSGSDELPSAPSAVQQERSKPKPPPPPPPPAKVEAQASTPTGTQTAPQPEPPAKSTPAPAATAPSQTDQNSTGPDDPTATITKTVNEVNVVFTVTDRHGHYVKNLAKSDFSVIDDSRPADQIRSFHNETELPLQVGLLV